MSYAIGVLIYGIPMTEYLEQELNEIENDCCEELDAEGILTTMYSGSAMHTCGYIGVKLGELNGFGHVHISIDKDNVPIINGTKLIVTEEQLDQFNKKIDSVSPEIKAVLENHIDTHGYNIVWGTS